MICLEDLVSKNHNYRKFISYKKSLYRTLSIQGNPTIINLFLMLDALGLELNVKAAV
jgi:DNA-binding phage protein